MKWREECKCEYPIKILAAFDNNSKVIDDNQVVPVYHIDKLEKVIEELDVEVVVLALPESEAQKTLERLEGMEIKGILSFSSTFIDISSKIVVQHVDLFSEVQTFAFNVSQN